jgi:FtsZ-binding cell division protein ZapB
MALGLQKLAVLESKLGIYEELSKEMLDKLERAVDKISEGNNQIAQVLARHEEKLENAMRADELLLHMMEEIKESNSKEHAVVMKRIENMETRVNDLATFRWITVGIATTAAVIISSAGFFGNILTTGNSGSTLGGANTTLSK